MTYKGSGLLLVLKTMILTLILIYLYIYVNLLGHSSREQILIDGRNDKLISNNGEFGATQNKNVEPSSDLSSETIKEWLKKMESGYARTTNNIKEVCRKYNMSSPMKPLYSNWLVDPNHQLAFCGNAKLGSTTWMHHFNGLLPEDERPWGNGTGTLRDSIRAQIVKKFHAWFVMNRDKGNFDAKTGEGFPESLQKDNISVFTFVRHPFERLVSAYNDKTNTEKVSFTRFVEKVLKRFDEQRVDIHWKLFIHNCHHCFVPYNIIGRMETFQEDVQYIILKHKLENILPIKTTLQFRSLNSSKRDSKKEALEKFSQLNQTVIEKLYNLYQLDFELFGYDINDYRHSQ